MLYAFPYLFGGGLIAAGVLIILVWLVTGRVAEGSMLDTPLLATGVIAAVAGVLVLWALGVF